MKKRIVIFIALFFVLIFASACSGDDVNNNNSSQLENNDESNIIDESQQVKLLEGYPADVLPLYKNVGITLCSFSYRDDYNYVIGKDIYSVDFESEGTLQEVSEYYQSIFTTIDEEYFEIDDFEGSIGDNNAFIGFSENDGTTSVSMTIGLDEDEYLDENPYFSDYPKDLIEVYAMTELQDIIYEDRNFSTREIRYITTYETNISQEEFIEFYYPKYSNMENFRQDEDQYGISYYWDNMGYECLVSYSGGNTRFISIEADIQP
ncbi:MAG: hypothetical protein ACOWWH_13080 [Eubacteriaceae bacterium]